MDDNLTAISERDLAYLAGYTDAMHSSRQKELLLFLIEHPGWSHIKDLADVLYGPGLMIWEAQYLIRPLIFSLRKRGMKIENNYQGGYRLIGLEYPQENGGE